MKAFHYSRRHANAIHVLARLLKKEHLTAEQIRTYDDQGRVIEYINNRLLVPVERMKEKQGDELLRVWYMTDQAIEDYHHNREKQHARQLYEVTKAKQQRKATTAAKLLAELGETVPESIRAILAANEDSFE